MPPCRSSASASDLNFEPCEVCGRVIRHKADVPRHKRLHKSNKEALMHRCRFEGCDYRNLQKSNVTTHERTHTGEKPKACPDCDFTTSDPGSLTRHRKRVHDYQPKKRTAVSSTGKTPAPKRSMRHSPYPRETPIQPHASYEFGFASGHDKLTWTWQKDRTCDLPTEIPPPSDWLPVTPHPSCDQRSPQQLYPAAGAGLTLEGLEEAQDTIATCSSASFGLLPPLPLDSSFWNPEDSFKFPPLAPVHGYSSLSFPAAPYPPTIYAQTFQPLYGPQQTISAVDNQLSAVSLDALVANQEPSFDQSLIDFSIDFSKLDWNSLLETPVGSASPSDGLLTYPESSSSSSQFSSPFSYPPSSFTDSPVSLSSIGQFVSTAYPEHYLYGIPPSC